MREDLAAVNVTRRTYTLAASIRRHLLPDERHSAPHEACAGIVAHGGGNLEFKAISCVTSHRLVLTEL